MIVHKPAARIAALTALTFAAAGGVAWAHLSHTLSSCSSTTAACLGGTNTLGGAGVLGTSATGIGVQGASTKSNPAVAASTAVSTSIFGRSVSGTGVRGTSATSDGVLGFTSSTAQAAVRAYSTAKTAPFAVSANSPSGIGLGAIGATAFSGTAFGICPTSGCTYDLNHNYDPITALTVNTVGTQTPFVLRNAKGQVVFSISYLGAVFFAGKLVCPNASFSVYNYKTMQSYTVCVASQLDRTLFRTREDRPVETYGQAILEGGVAQIALPDDFTTQANTRGSYQVYLSALGDTGAPLYVAGRYARGFVVRSTGTANRSITFAYRVVAPRVGGAPIASPSAESEAATDRTNRVGPAELASVAGTAQEPERAVPLAGPTPCSLTISCEEGQNTSTGIAVEGISKTGYGVEGTSPGSAGIGVEGTAVAGIGAYGLATTGYGVEATSVSGTALSGASASKSAAGVLGESLASKAGVGLEALSTYGSGISSTGLESFSGSGLVTVKGNYGAPLLIVHNPSAKIDIFSVDDGGIVGFNDIWNCPAVYSSAEGTCLAVTSLTGQDVHRVERTGEGRIVDGVATVRLDPWLAAHLDRSQTYSVDITPEGDSTGWLYVDNRTPGGFTVREHGGSSNLTFEYDIVANTIGTSH